MSKKRSDIEISADILHVARNGVKKSHIVYKANLNFNIVKKYLDRLITSGLLRVTKGENRVFRTTEKGVDYINYFKGFKDYLNIQEPTSYKGRPTHHFPRPLYRAAEAAYPTSSLLTG